MSTIEGVAFITSSFIKIEEKCLMVKIKIAKAFLMGFLFVIFVSINAFAAKYDFFGGYIPKGAPIVDGVLQPGEWNELGHTTLYKFLVKILK